MVVFTHEDTSEMLKLTSQIYGLLSHVKPSRQGFVELPCTDIIQTMELFRQLESTLHHGQGILSKVDFDSAIKEVSNK